MRYTVVKQFSNGVIDNIFSFIFKWVDCAKMFLEFLWSFIEIWIAFFLIFYNIYMYLYYLLLFFIDRGSERSVDILRLRGTYSKASHIPKFEITGGPNVVPPMYGVKETATQAMSSLKSATSLTIKKPLTRRILASFADFFKSLARIIALPFKKLVLLFDHGVELRNQREADSHENKSLIDEYIKEYERKKK